jgi:hypothetical protein
MRTGIIAAPAYDLAQAVVDQPLDDPLGVVWRLPLTGFDTVSARLDSVSGAAVLTSEADGVVALGANHLVDDDQIVVHTLLRVARRAQGRDHRDGSGDQARRLAGLFA